MSDHIPTTAAGWLDKALHFIEAHPDGWDLYPGQDLHGWIVAARKALSVEAATAARRLQVAVEFARDAQRTPARERMTDHMLQRWALLAGAEVRTTEEEAEVRRLSDWLKVGGVDPEAPVREAKIVGTRTAEDERRDVLAYLRNRCAIFTAAAEIERGDHEGAADR